MGAAGSVTSSGFLEGDSGGEDGGVRPLVGLCSIFSSSGIEEGAWAVWPFDGEGGGGCWTAAESGVVCEAVLTFAASLWAKKAASSSSVSPASNLARLEELEEDMMKFVGVVEEKSKRSGEEEREL